MSIPTTNIPTIGETTTRKPAKVPPVGPVGRGITTQGPNEYFGTPGTLERQPQQTMLQFRAPTRSGLGVSTENSTTRFQAQ